MGQFSQTILAMKVLAAVLLLATLAQSRPRHMVIPFDDEYEQPQVRFVPISYRTARAAFPQAPEGAPAFAIPDAIRSAEEQIAAGSGPSPAIAGGDALTTELTLEAMVLLDGTLITLIMKALVTDVDKSSENCFLPFDFSLFISSCFSALLQKTSFLLLYRKINFIHKFYRR